MGYIGKNSLVCEHGDEQSKCPFCYDIWKETGKSPEPVGTYGEVQSRKNKKVVKGGVKQDYETLKLNRQTKRLLDQVIETIKDTEWPAWADPADWRMVVINSIEKRFGRE